MAAQPQTPKITDDSYPTLFTIADKASQDAQRLFLRLVAADLFFLIVGTILSSISLCGGAPAGSINWPRVIATGMGVTFGISLCLTILLRTKKYERVWYGGRALAEAVRTMTWRYMTCAEPYTADLTPAAADGKFAEALAALITTRREAALVTGVEMGSGRREITEDMRRARQLDTVARRQFYVKDRLEDQVGWYGRRARLYQKREDAWFMLIMLAQFMAFVSALIYVQWYDRLPLNIISIFAALATVLFSWLQIKQYQELAQSYSLTAHQLDALLSGKAPHINTDAELSAFVIQVETIMGREHELWEIKRERI
jgi:hypothetical protein